MGNDRTDSVAGANPSGDLDGFEPHRRGRASPKLRELSMADQGTVRHSDRRKIEERAQVDGQTGPTRVVCTGCVDHDHIGTRRECLQG
jgi:hypothetical protein